MSAWSLASGAPGSHPAGFKVRLCHWGGRLPPTPLLKMTNQENEGSSAELHLLGSSRHRHGRPHPCLVPGLLLERVCLSDGHGAWPDHEDALLCDTGSAVRRAFGGQSLL